MRYRSDVIVERASMHVLDTLADEALLNTKEMELNDRIYNFIESQIVKSLNDFNCKKGKFFGPSGLMCKAVNEGINSDDFLESSKKIAKHLFQVLKKYDGGFKIVQCCVIQFTSITIWCSQ